MEAPPSVVEEQSWTGWSTYSAIAQLTLTAEVAVSSIPEVSTGCKLAPEAARESWTCIRSHCTHGLETECAVSGSRCCPPIDCFHNAHLNTALSPSLGPSWSGVSTGEPMLCSVAVGPALAMGRIVDRRSHDLGSVACG